MKLKPLFAILSGICLLLFSIGLGLVIVFLLRGIYANFIDDWNLEAISGLSREEILLNYNALMDWCSPFYTQELSLPTLAMSATGAEHFAEVKVLFNEFLLAGVISLPVFAGIFVAAAKKKAGSVLKGAGAVCIGIPVVLLGIFAIDFDRAFILFHQIFFPGNTYWIFDPATDPVINILPEELFMICAIVICAVVLLAGILSFVGGILINRRKRVQ